MPQKTVVILASARKESETKKKLQKLCAEVECDIIDLLDFQIKPYSYSGNYSTPDNFKEIIERIICYERIVFATPVYWYSMSGLLKNFFDRLTDLVTINKLYGRKLKGKRTFLLAVGADGSLPEGFEIPFTLTSKYFGMDFITSIYFSTSNTSLPGIEKQKIDRFLLKFIS